MHRSGTKQAEGFRLNREQAVYPRTQAGTPAARALAALVVKVLGRNLPGTPKAMDFETAQ